MGQGERFARSHQVIRLGAVAREEVVRAPEVEQKGAHREFAMAARESFVFALEVARPVANGERTAQCIVGQLAHVQARAQQDPQEPRDVDVVAHAREDVPGHERPAEPPLLRGHEVAIHAGLLLQVLTQESSHVPVVRQMLQAAHEHGAVEGAAGAVVEEVHALDAAGKALRTDPLRHEIMLVARQRDTLHADPPGAGVLQEGAPAAAHVEDLHARLEP